MKPMEGYPELERERIENIKNNATPLGSIKCSQKSNVRGPLCGLDSTAERPSYVRKWEVIFTRPQRGRIISQQRLNPKNQKYIRL